MSPKGAHRQSRRREEEEASDRESRSLRPEEIEALLLEGKIEGIDLIPHGSNYTFAVRLHLDDFRFFGIAFSRLDRGSGVNRREPAPL